MNTNTTVLTADTAESILSTAYAPIGQAITKAVRKLADAKGGVWAAVRSALPVAVQSGHDAADMREGIRLALEAVDTPQGTIRSYLPTVENMLAEIATGTLTLDDAMKMGVEVARKRYKAPKAEKAESEGEETGEGPKDAERSRLLSKLATLLSDVDNAELAEVVQLVADYCEEC